MYRIDELLRVAAGTSRKDPDLERIIRSGKRRMWVERSVSGALSLTLLFGGAAVVSRIDGGEGPSPAAQSPPARGIVFSGQLHSENELAVYVLNPESGDRTKIFDKEVGGEQLPAWSPDGLRIALGVNVAPGTPETVDENIELTVIKSDGSGAQRLTHKDGLDQDPTWSPDGSRLAFFSSAEGPIREYDGGGQGPNGIWAMKADGSGLHKISEGDGLSHSPEWSPDGSRIAFIKHAPGGRSELFLMDPDGSNQTRLIDHGHSLSSPEWSPDGSQIAFVENADGSGSPTAIFVVDVDAGRTRKVASLNAAEGRAYLAWSPTGTKIAYTAGNLGDEMSIMVLSLDGGVRSELASGFSYIDGLDWR